METDSPDREAFKINCASSKVQRRALLVGIDRYARSGTPVLHSSNSGGRVPLLGDWRSRTLPNLRAAVRDACLMYELLTTRLGFEIEDTHLLCNEQAGADNILTAIRLYLIDMCQPGDQALFYFAGHGSRIRNLASTEPDGMDEALVAADAALGAPDIRDKELVRLFRLALQKGVVPTIIIDCCHSGSIVRAGWEETHRIRSACSDNRYVNDPPEVDNDGNTLLLPEQEGALILSACQDDGQAMETAEPGKEHGVFTSALVEVLRAVGLDESASSVFRRVRARMQVGLRRQEPVMAGHTRHFFNLLGGPCRDPGSEVTVPIARIQGNLVHLGGGLAIGLAEGCKLRQSGVSPEYVELVVRGEVALAGCSATIIAGKSEHISPGDLFEVISWEAPQRAAVCGWIPKICPTTDELFSSITKFKTLCEKSLCTWLPDPTTVRSSHTLQWDRDTWLLRQAGSPGIDATPLRDTFKRVLAANINSEANVAAFLPPPQELVDALPTTHLSKAHSSDDTPYRLIGRLGIDGLEFCWSLRGMTEEDMATEHSSGNFALSTMLPLRTDWIKLHLGAIPQAAAALDFQARQLERILAWLRLQSPLGTEFAYSLELKHIATGESRTGGNLYAGEQYRLALRRKPDFAGSSQLVKRYIYVFSLDQHGKRTLLFPMLGQGNVENRFTASLWKQDEWLLPNTQFNVAPPFGVDHFLLLTTDSALDTPEILEDAAVRTRGRSSPLEDLVLSLEQGFHGGFSIPSHWSIERITFLSAHV